MSKFDLSIIVVSYNTETITINCLNSIIRSVRNIKYEIIIIDNASSDDSVREIQKLKSKKNVKFTIIQNKSNLGFARANNIGIKAAEGDYILLLNSDVVVLDDAIEKLYRHFTNHQDQIDFLGGKLFNQDMTPQPSCGPFYSLLMIFAHLFLRGDYWGLTRYSPSRKKEVDWISGACILTKKSSLQKLGGFDEKIFMYMDEIDLLYRARQLNLHAFFYPESRFIHLGSASSASRTYPINQVFKGLRYFYKKHHSPSSYKILSFMLKLKARTGYFFGRVFKNKYLTETYEKAYQIACLD